MSVSGLRSKKVNGIWVLLRGSFGGMEVNRAELMGERAHWCMSIYPILCSRGDQLMR